MKFEYVISGLNFAYLLSACYRADPAAVDATKRSIDAINDGGAYDVSALFNAYAETNNGKPLKENYGENFHNIHVDSGGLQVITRGLDITQALKKQIYTTQATYGDVAMCFDEIPLRVSAAGGHRATTDNKVFVVADMADSAKKTGENISEQLRMFAELGSQTKVMMIVQGNNRYDFAKWGEIVYDVIDDDLKSQIHGLALADTCCGNGALETVEMCAAVPIMQVPDGLKKNIHFLGVGSISRLVPVIELSRGKIFGDAHISFDSTSHSSTLVMGKITDDLGRMTKLGKTANRGNINFFRGVYDDISSFYDIGVDFDDYIQYVISKLNTTRHLSDTSDPYLSVSNMTYWFTVRRCVNNFMTNIIKCQADPNHYYEMMGRQHARALKPMLTLGQVNCAADMDKWFEQCSRYVNSNRIARVDNTGSVDYGLSLFDIA